MTAKGGVWRDSTKATALRHLIERRYKTQYSRPIVQYVRDRAIYITAIAHLPQEERG
ncbi:hypothetical protein M404DRAFT_994788 [Pisolithus tinctorius Marx 270]|uniref:Uncharacterized protein n=1 Tax=Pisolithus tinctorius Marx 270 TaxID=870435 RepID=A0A0C3PQ59_PISTI|nr:hypothetical protein M404DRAFT_994788 [Pisolithus tinctorius Marx 270]